MDNKTIGMLVVGAGALYLLTQMGGSPAYYDMNGKQISATTCGTSATFNVPGYKRVWLDILRDKQLSFSGAIDVPMPPYIFSCSNDVGAYDIAAYEVDANDAKGKLIGQTTFTVYPQA